MIPSLIREAGFVGRQLRGGGGGARGRGAAYGAPDPEDERVDVADPSNAHSSDLQVRLLFLLRHMGFRRGCQRSSRNHGSNNRGN